MRDDRCNSQITYQNHKDSKIRIFDRERNCLASLDLTQGIAEAEIIPSSEKDLAVLFYVCDTENVTEARLAEWVKREMPQRRRSSGHMDPSHIAAGEMLYQAMGKLGYSREEVAADYIGQEGERPYFAHLPVDFSITHSHSLALLVLCRRKAGEGPEIGVDLETGILGRKIDPVRLAKRFFTENEGKSIASSPSPMQDFMRIWVMKEAWMKREGIPLSRAFQVEVMEECVQRIVLYIEGEGLLGVIVA